MAEFSLASLVCSNRDCAWLRDTMGTAFGAGQSMRKLCLLGLTVFVVFLFVVPLRRRVGGCEVQPHYLLLVLLIQVHKMLWNWLLPWAKATTGPAGKAWISVKKMRVESSVEGQRASDHRSVPTSCVQWQNSVQVQQTLRLVVDRQETRLIHDDIMHFANSTSLNAQTSWQVVVQMAGNANWDFGQQEIASRNSDSYAVRVRRRVLAMCSEGASLTSPQCQIPDFWCGLRYD